MQRGNHCCFSDARNQALIDRRSRCDAQRMTVQTSFAKKVVRFQNTYDCFLATLGNDGELDLAPLDVKNRVRLATLRKNNLVLLILGYGFPIAHFGEKCFRLECGLPTLLHEEVLFPRRTQDHVRQSGINSGNHTAIPTPEINILAGVTLTHFALCTLP
jgi:hypothetical protein